ncbi:hypothetical protein HAX54_042322 [Datura stramonium]|uniref:Histone H2A/H2B/H3 domain-containing protein n=1 Tax=Datura stramonium TaxID=4076 RepID=A0ABS8W303_DATST|nr:hypothetical protein [Datura stramonium]
MALGNSCNNESHGATPSSRVADRLGCKNTLGVAGQTSTYLAEKRNKQLAYTQRRSQQLRRLQPPTRNQRPARSFPTTLAPLLPETRRRRGRRSRLRPLGTTRSPPSLLGRFIYTAIRLVLPCELAKHAVTKGTKAVNKITSF